MTTTLTTVQDDTVNEMDMAAGEEENYECSQFRDTIFNPK